MNKLWPVVNKNNPCPICGRPDWCAIGDRAVKCMRVESDHPCPSGGWYHKPGGSFREFAARAWHPLTKRCNQPRLRNVESIMRQWQDETVTVHMAQNAALLGVDELALRRTGACFAREYYAWAFPMHDENKNMIGIRLRNGYGKKWAVPGSRNGLFIPDDFDGSDLVFVCEGPTSLAAVLTMDLMGVGRPSCNSGEDMLIAFLREQNVKRVVLVADRDEKKMRPDGSAFYPGLDGVNKLRKQLGRIKSVIWKPPCKDVRQWISFGHPLVQRQLLLVHVRQMVWR